MDPTIKNLLSWYEGQLHRVEAERISYSRLLDEPGASTDLDVVLLGGRIEGKDMLLGDLSRFILDMRAQAQKPSTN